MRPDDARDESRRDERQSRLPGPCATGDAEPLAGADGERDVGQARLPASGIADPDGVELEPRRLGHRPSPRTTTATTRHGRHEDHQAQPAIDRRVGDASIRRPLGPRPEAAGFKSEGALADVDERAQDDRPDERYQRSDACQDRARDGQATCLLRFEDGTGPCLHARHHLDDREDHEGQSMADPAGDEGFEDVVGQRREQEQHGGQEDDQQTAGRDDPEGESFARSAPPARAGR